MGQSPNQKDNMKTLLEKTLELPPCEWAAAIEKTYRKDPQSLQALEIATFAIAKRAALLGAYIAHRYNTGCGDQGHEASAKIASRTIKRIRKVLGYSYPNATDIRIP